MGSTTINSIKRVGVLRFLKRANNLLSLIPGRYKVIKCQSREGGYLNVTFEWNEELFILCYFYHRSSTLSIIGYDEALYDFGVSCGLSKLPATGINKRFIRTTLVNLKRKRVESSLRSYRWYRDHEKLDLAKERGIV